MQAGRRGMMMTTTTASCRRSSVGGEGREKDIDANLSPPGFVSGSTQSPTTATITEGFLRAGLGLGSGSAELEADLEELSSVLWVGWWCGGRGKRGGREELEVEEAELYPGLLPPSDSSSSVEGVGEQQPACLPGGLETTMQCIVLPAALLCTHHPGPDMHQKSLLPCLSLPLPLPSGGGMDFPDSDSEGHQTFTLGGVRALSSRVSSRAPPLRPPEPIGQPIYHRWTHGPLAPLGPPAVGGVNIYIIRDSTKWPIGGPPSLLVAERLPPATIYGVRTATTFFWEGGGW
ncbi:hypothetical protein DFH27DRAFT_652050 [Peziza echinospora]|nr:hypothetical protein DFH27DRAFT_652050 [Peziza echinospora]